MNAFAFLCSSIFALAAPACVVAQDQLAGVKPIAVHVTVISSVPNEAKLELQRIIGESAYKALRDRGVPTTKPGNIEDEKNPFLHYEFAVIPVNNEFALVAQLSLKIQVASPYNGKLMYASLRSDYRLRPLKSSDAVNSDIKQFFSKSISRFAKAWVAANPKLDADPKTADNHRMHRSGGG